MKVHTHTFPSGLRLVYQEIEDTRPASINICINVGAIDENENNLGISHFIEHMSFKGTKKREGKDIARNFEEIGASVNAYTTINRTCYYATGLSEKFEEMFDLLSEIVFCSTYNEEDIETERKVIFEEIDRDADDPQGVAFQNYNKIFYSGSILSLDALGTKETLKNIGRKEIISFVKEYYVPNKIIVSVTTSVKFNKVKEYVTTYINDKFFKGIKGKVEEKNKSRTIVPDKKFISVKKDVNQAQVIFGFPTDNVYSTDYMTNQVLSYILGGSMGSRLFRHVRDDEGLVYSISSFATMYEFGGDFSICFGTNDKSAKKAVDIIKREINDLLKNGIDAKELERAKIYLKSSLLYSNEKSSRIARKNMVNTLLFGKVLTMEEKLQEIDAVSLDDLMRVARKVFNFSNICGCVVSKGVREEIFESLE